MSRLFQIKEDDLVTLESLLPQIVDTAMQALDNNKSRVQIRRVQAILSDVRWDYGPPTDVEIIPVGGKG